MMTSRQQAVILRKLLEEKLGRKPETTRREIEHIVRCSIIGDYRSLYQVDGDTVKRREYHRLHEIIFKNPEGIMEAICPNESAGMSIEELKVYFSSGRIVNSYGDSVDEVIVFKGKHEGNWMVQVQKVGDAIRRNHCTMPLYKDLYKYKQLNEE